MGFCDLPVVLNSSVLVFPQCLWAFVVVSWGKLRLWRQSRVIQRPQMSSCVQSPESWWRILSLLQVRRQIMVYSMNIFFFPNMHYFYCLSVYKAFTPQMGIPTSETPSRIGSGARAKPVPWQTCFYRTHFSPPIDRWRRQYHDGSRASRQYFILASFSASKLAGNHHLPTCVLIIALLRASLRSQVSPSPVEQNTCKHEIQLYFLFISSEIHPRNEKVELMI